LEQARINDQLDKERISNITLVQPASFVAKPSGPRKIYVLGSASQSHCWARSRRLARAMFDPASAADDIEAILRLPVLGVVRVGVA